MKRMARACRRTVLVGAAATLAATTIAGVAPAQPDRSGRDAASAMTPMLRLTSATKSVTLERHRHRVELALGMYAAASDDEAFEIQAHRPSWKEPIQAFIQTTGGEIAMPEDSMSNFAQVRRFFELTFTDKAGDIAYTRTIGFCPSGESVRINPDVPNPKTAYPSGCPYNPYTRGAVYGISPGYALPIFGEYGDRARLPLGHYTATVTIRREYADLMGLTPEDATTSVKVDVVKSDGQDCSSDSPGRGCKTAGPVNRASEDSTVPKIPGKRPTGPSLDKAPTEIRPDLRSLPAFAIELHRGYVSFAANVWNAGPSPLVVDGFRRSDEDVMDAFQYFYDTDGNEIGYASAGEMEWDARDGHTHWHFRDFARYRLLDSDKQGVVRSRKEAFCLANTDAVDYTVEGANWNPYNTDLHTSCGGYTSLAVREVLDTGSGDTYYQGLPGQSFNIKNLENGVYYIAVEANPHGVMQEKSTSNNVSYRKIILKGSGDNRRLVVPRKGIIDEREQFYF